jgi:LysW-gamma-L-lysine carboxypeptidase
MNYISGGQLFSVIPKLCEGVIDVRVPIGMKLSDVKSKIDALLSTYCSYEVIDETPPVRVSVNVPVVRALVRAIIKNGLKPSPAIKLGTSDMNLLVSLTDNIVSYGPGRSELAHTDHEEVSIEELELGAKVYKDLILEFFTNT